MTIQEIRDLIAKKIAGQGTQVDVGGGLATILNAICDALATIPSPYTLPAATTEALGGVKIGSGLQVAADGTASLKVPVITETLGDSPVEITVERYIEITNSPLALTSDGMCSRLETPDLLKAIWSELGIEVLSGIIFISHIGYDSGTTLSAAQGFAAYGTYDGVSNKYYLQLVDY